MTNVECDVSDLLANVDLSGGLFDFATANIVVDIIVRMAPDIGAYLKTGGLLITSGIIEPLRGRRARGYEVERLRAGRGAHGVGLGSDGLAQKVTFS